MSLRSLLNELDNEDGTSTTTPLNHGPEHELLKDKLTTKLSTSLDPELSRRQNMSNCNSTENTVNENTLRSEDSKTGWNKVADSLRTFSSRRNTSSSVDESLNDRCDKDYFRSEPLMKTSSELDLQSSSINESDVKDGGSKKMWFKGQLSSYLSKSKNYYNNRGSLSAPTSETGINDTDINNQKESVSRNSDEIKTILHDKTAPIPIKSIVLTSLSSEESHLSLMQTTQTPPMNTNKSPSEPPKKGGTTKKTASKMLSKFNTEKSMKTNLSLSELLHSQSNRSLSSSADELSTEPPKTSSPFLKPSVQQPTSTTTTLECEDKLPSQQELEVLTDVIVKEDLKHHFKPSQDFPVTFYHLWLSSLAMFYYLLFDLPPFLSGLVTGGLIVFLFGCSFIWFFAPSGDVYNQYREDLKKFLLDNSSEKLPHEVFKSIPKPELLQKPRRLKVM